MFQTSQNRKVDMQRPGPATVAFNSSISTLTSWEELLHRLAITLDKWIVRVSRQMLTQKKLAQYAQKQAFLEVWSINTNVTRSESHLVRHYHESVPSSHTA
jgi:hypothetical protein